MHDCLQLRAGVMGVGYARMAGNENVLGGAIHIERGW